ncbi:DUF5776 domain-containing protein [Lactobacillaceae bacterium Melli_B4]
MKKIFYLVSISLLLPLGIQSGLTTASANSNHVEKAKVVKTINNIKVYNGKVFKHARVIKSVKVGEKLLIKKLVHTGGMTRFELTDGHYITANKRYVKLLN